MIKYTYNPKNKKLCYHIATATGTLCKLENAGDLYINAQIPFAGNPPENKICKICTHLKNRYEGKNSLITSNTLLITIGKLYNGYRPGDEGWSDIDQRCLEMALRG